MADGGGGVCFCSLLVLLIVVLPVIFFVILPEILPEMPTQQLVGDKTLIVSWFVCLAYRLTCLCPAWQLIAARCS